jgi:hypothetical protein
MSGRVAPPYADERAAGRIQDALHGTKPGARCDPRRSFDEQINLRSNAAAEAAEQLSRKLRRVLEQPLRIHFERTLD